MHCIAVATGCSSLVRLGGIRGRCQLVLQVHKLLTALRQYKSSKYRLLGSVARTPSAQTFAEGSATNVCLRALYAIMTSGGAYHSLKLNGASAPVRLAHPKSMSVHSMLDGNHITFAGFKQTNACEAYRRLRRTMKQVAALAVHI